MPNNSSRYSAAPWLGAALSAALIFLLFPPAADLLEAACQLFGLKTSQLLPPCTVLATFAAWYWCSRQLNAVPIRSNAADNPLLLFPEPAAVIDGAGVVLAGNSAWAEAFPQPDAGREASTLTSLTAESNRQAVTTALRMAVIHDQWQGLLPLAADGHRREFLIQKCTHNDGFPHGYLIRPLPGSRIETASLIVAQDIREEVELRHQANVLLQSCQTMGEAYEQIASDQPEGVLIPAILGRLARQFGARRTILAMHHPESPLLQLSWDNRGPLDNPLFAARGAVDQLYEQLAAGNIVRCEDSGICKMLECQHVVCLPIRCRGQLLAVIACGSDKPLSPEIHPFLTAIGGILAATATTSAQVKQINELKVQLRQSQRLETVGLLASGIAHDFNNILTPITGFLQFAMQEVDSTSQAYADLEHVQEGAERARNLVAQILSFGRGTESGRTILDPADVITRTVKLVRGPLPSTITISTDIAENLSISADPGQIHQVLLNLCTNAYQAMRQTGGTISISLRRRKLEQDDPDLKVGMIPGNYACISIRDSGPGMSAEVAARIFEPFFTTKEEGEGTGLGLVVVNGIVTAHGGGIAITTSPGHGAEFRVYFPLLPESAPSLPAAILPVVSEIAGSDAIRVLFCDDEQGITNLAERRLRNANFSVHAFTHATAALAAFESAPDSFDVVVTDQTMPEMTGIELIESIHTQRPDLPAILASGYSPQFAAIDMENADSCRQFGATRFLRKPYMMDDLILAIREISG